MRLDLEKAYLLLGSNLGEREYYLAEALRLINERVGFVFAKSAIYETAAWGKINQPGFLNLATGVQTSLTAIELLDAILQIEADLGRIRQERWGARVIDIDIILYGDEIIDVGDKLQIPHKEMQNRKFVMQPLCEIAPDVVHPVIKKTMSEIFTTLSDSLSVAKR